MFIAARGAELPEPAVLLSVVLWGLVLVYTLPVGYWLYQMLLYAAKSTEPGVPRVPRSLDEFQVRILTVDNEEVVQETVNRLPDEFTDVVVIAEREIRVDGAKVLVVPRQFSCRASAKGRALEWARREHPVPQEYVLYLDEDTVVPDLPSPLMLPDADIVQFRERPTRTGSLISYMAEIHRIGFNLEQKAFPHLKVPLYAWGGGIAIRTSVEDRVTWDVETMVEDSVFAWRAILEQGASYAVVDIFFQNQSPPTLRSMVNQRRRWLTGTRQQTQILPRDYRVLYNVRDAGWALSSFAPLIWLLSTLAYAGVVPFSLEVIYFPHVYTVLSFTLLGFVFIWTLLGLYIYREAPGFSLLLVALTPFVVMLHSLGALYGLLLPAVRFEVTEKVTTRT